MEPLEIELAYIQQLVDEDVARLLYQHFDWEVLDACSELFDLDISNITRPLDVLPELIARKADQHLPEGKAERFKVTSTEVV